MKNKSIPVWGLLMATSILIGISSAFGAAFSGKGSGDYKELERADLLTGYIVESESLVPDSLWTDADVYPDNWYRLDWFGKFNQQVSHWIYHEEHGWWYVTGDSTEDFKVYDAALNLWGACSDVSYPWIFWFNPVHDWMFYQRGGQPGERLFYSPAAGEWLHQADLKPKTEIVVAGGTLDLSIGKQTVATFWMSRHEVTWGKFQMVRTWAADNGYDIGAKGAGCAEDHPVRSIGWYDAVKWCNARSEMEGLTPVYTVSGNIFKAGLVAPDWNTAANGYRLPGEAEWEFAARGGNLTNGYTYSGNSSLGSVGWYDGNTTGAECNTAGGRGTWPVGQLGPNELGLYDMSGNVWEWCWDPFFAGRQLRGGSWNSTADQCTVSYRDYFVPLTGSFHIGFRVARNFED